MRIENTCSIAGPHPVFLTALAFCAAHLIPTVKCRKLICSYNDTTKTLVLSVQSSQLILFLQCIKRSSFLQCPTYLILIVRCTRLILFLQCIERSSFLQCPTYLILIVRCTWLIWFLQCIERISVLQWSVQKKANLDLTVQSIKLIVFLQCGTHAHCTAHHTVVLMLPISSFT